MSKSLLAPYADPIPQALREARRWVVWVAVRKPDGKISKVPRQALSPGRGASTNTPAHWCDFETAWRAYRAHSNALAGVGYVLTVDAQSPAENDPPLFAIDLDDCAPDDPRLAAIRSLGTYVEQSPSGNGYRAFGFGRIDRPYVNHAAGVEVYDGTSPRYVTVTGHRLRGRPSTVQVVDPALLAEVLAMWAPSGAAPDADATREPLPPLPTPEAAQRLHAEIERTVPERCLLYWADGIVPPAYPSRSEVCQAIAVAACSAGIEAHVVWGGMLANTHVLTRYLDARHSDHDRAAQALWSDVLRARVRAAEHPTGPTPPSAFPVVAEPAAQAAQDAPPALLIDAPQLQAGRPPEWLVHGYVERGTCATLFGAPGSGKSFVALDLACHVALGLPWCDRRTHEGGVVYVAGEGHRGITRRLEAWCLSRQLTLAALARLAVSRRAVPLLDSEAVRELLSELVARHAATGWTTSLIVVDTVAANFGVGDENSAADVARLMGACQTLVQVTGATVLLVHHSGHTTGRERGSSALIGATDARYRVDQDEHGVRLLAPLKMKDAVLPPARPFRLRQVALMYVDEIGETVTSAVVDWGSDAPATGASPAAPGAAPRLEVHPRLGRRADVALRALQAMLASAPMPAPAPERQLGARHVVTVEQWRQRAMASGLDRGASATAAQRTWRRARDDLERAGLVGLSDDVALAWVTEGGLRYLGDPLWS